MMGPREYRTMQGTINPERIGKSIKRIREPHGLEAPKIRKLAHLQNHAKYVVNLMVNWCE